MSEIITLSIKTPRDSSTTPEAAKTMLSAFTRINSVGFWEKILLGKKASKAVRRPGVKSGKADQPFSLRAFGHQKPYL